MKLSDLMDVNRLESARAALLGQLKALDGALIQVKVEDPENFMGRRSCDYADTDMTSAVKASVRAELERRLAVNGEALVALGVDL